MKPVSKVTEAIKPSGIRKFFDIVSEMPDAISLGVGEPDFETPWQRFGKPFMIEVTIRGLNEQ